MSYKIRIDDKYDVKLKDAFTITEQLDDTLDSGEVFFNTKQELDIQPFDKVNFYDGTTKLFSQLIDNIRVESVNPFQDNEIYGTTIRTFSATKYLEKITLPNLSITRSKVGSPKSILYYLQIYVLMYSPKYRKRISGNAYEMKSIIDVDTQEISDKFGSVDCPEFQWNNPTLREVLNDLMMTCDCLPILLTSDNSPKLTLSFIDYSAESNRNIDTSKLNRKVKEYNSTDYCSELTLNMKNTLSEQSTIVPHYAGLRNPNGGQHTDESYAVVLNSPIYEIKSMFCHYLSDNGIEVIGMPVVEESVYNILPSGTWLDPVGPNDKYHHIKYKRGSNIIDGFGYKPDAMCVDYAIDRILSNATHPVVYNKNRSIYFSITYTTQSDRTMHIGKYLPTAKHQIRNFDAQTSSYADPKRMSIFEYHKVNRIGNEIIEIGGTYTNYNDVPKLGDKIGNLVLFKRTLEFRDNCIIFNGLMTKHYVLRDYFTSVRAKQRSWQYVQDSEALTRYDVDKFYCEFSFESMGANYDYEVLPEYQDEYSYYRENIGAYILSNGLYKNGCVGIRIKFADDSYTPTGATDVYELDTLYEENGLSIVITYQLLDNYSIGLYNYYRQQGLQSAWYSDYYKIVDNDGCFAEINLMYGHFMPEPDQPQWQAKDIDQRMEVVNAMPKASILYAENLIRLEHIKVYKDNAEIIKRSLQFEFCSDTEDIVITDDFITKTNFFNTNDVSAYHSDIKPNLANRSRMPSDLQSASPTITLTGRKVEIAYSNLTAEQIQALMNKYLYLVDSATNKLMMCVALSHIDTTTKTLTFYLNVLTTRDKNVYN